MKKRNDGATINVDRPCIGCGHNVRGLQVGGRCPECGLPIIAADSLDDPLSQMPIHVIRRLRRGCILALPCSLGIILSFFWIQMAGAMLKYAVVLLGVSAVLWQIASWWTTSSFNIPQARWRGYSEGDPLRIAARWSQPAWLAAPTLLLWQMALPAGAAASPMLEMGIFLSWIAGLVAFMLYGVMMMRLGDWMHDNDVARTINVAVWGVPGLLILGASFAFSIPLLGLFVGIAWLVSLLCFPLGLFQLARSVNFSLHHSLEYQDRLERQREKQERYASQVARSVAVMDIPVEPQREARGT